MNSRKNKPATAKQKAELYSLKKSYLDLKQKQYAPLQLGINIFLTRLLIPEIASQVIKNFPLFEEYIAELYFTDPNFNPDQLIREIAIKYIPVYKLCKTANLNLPPELSQSIMGDLAACLEKIAQLKIDPSNTAIEGLDKLNIISVLKAGAFYSKNALLAKAYHSPQIFFQYSLTNLISMLAGLCKDLEKYELKHLKTNQATQLISESIISIGSYLILIPANFFIVHPWLASKFAEFNKDQLVIKAKQNNLNELTAAEAEEEIAEFTEKNAKLKPYAQKMKLASLLALSLFDVYTGQRNLIESTVSFGLGALWVYHDDIIQYYHSYKLDANLANLKSCIDEALYGYQKSPCQIFKYNNLEQSSILLNINSYQNMKPTVVVKIIKNILFKHGVHIISTSQNEIIISANTKFNKNNTQKINEEIKQTLMQYLQLQTLQRQMESLSNAMGIFIYRSGLLKNSAGAIEYKFMLEPLHDNLLTEIKKIFPQCKFTEENGCPRIIGNISGDQVLLKKLINRKDLQKASIIIPKAEKASNVLVAETATVFSSAPSLLGEKKDLLSRKDQAKLDDSSFFRPSKREKQNANQVEEKLITWKGNFFYDLSGEKESKVTSVRAPCYGENQVFTLFQLKREDFPNEAAYKAVKRVTRDGKVSNQGQGLRFIDKDMKDINGKNMKAKLKVKVSGENFGNIRAYGEEIINPDGKKLYVIKALNLRAHQ